MSIQNKLITEKGGSRTARDEEHFLFRRLTNADGLHSISSSASSSISF